MDDEIDALADRVAFGRKRDGLGDGVQVAPAFGEAAFSPERGADTAVAVL